VKTLEGRVGGPHVFIGWEKKGAGRDAGMEKGKRGVRIPAVHVGDQDAAGKGKGGPGHPLAMSAEKGREAKGGNFVLWRQERKRGTVPAYRVFCKKEGGGGPGPGKRVGWGTRVKKRWPSPAFSDEGTEKGKKKEKTPL